MPSTITVYTAKELKEDFPEGFERAHQEFAEGEAEFCPWQEEIVGSLKKTFEFAGLNLTNWSLGAYGNSWVKFTMPTYWSELADCEILVEEYTGQRAMNWLKDAFGIKSAKLVHYKNHLGKPAKRYDFKEKSGEPWDCPLTGMCFDYNFVESLFMDVHDGQNLEDAFRGLAGKCETMLEAELTYSQSEENFLEMASANNWEYTEDGKMI